MVIGSEMNGNVETITYEHQGKKYQEVRVHEEKRIVPERYRGSIKALMERGGLDEEQALQVAMTLGNFDWKKYRHLDEKWPPSAVEKMRKQVASHVKNDIARIIGSAEPSALQKVLKVDVGFEVVPMGDYVVRADCRAEPAAKK